MTINSITGEVGDGDFAVFLSTVRPVTNEELGEKIRTVVHAVRDTGKTGSVTLTVLLKPLDNNANVIEVTDQIKVKIPEHDRKPSIAYPDKEDNLGRTDPNAFAMFNDPQASATGAEQ